VGNFAYLGRYDKGYIGHELFKKLWQRGLYLITGIRRNMKNYLMSRADKIMLRKRFLIETVLDTLKSEMGLEHSRHRSPVNAMVHVLSCLVAYAFRPGKPSISLSSTQIEAYHYSCTVDRESIFSGNCRNRPLNVATKRHLSVLCNCSVIRSWGNYTNPR